MGLTQAITEVLFCCFVSLLLALPCIHCVSQGTPMPLVQIKFVSKVVKYPCGMWVELNSG